MIFSIEFYLNHPSICIFFKSYIRCFFEIFPLYSILRTKKMFIVCNFFVIYLLSWLLCGRKELVITKDELWLFGALNLLDYCLHLRARYYCILIIRFEFQFLTSFNGPIIDCNFAPIFLINHFIFLEILLN